MFKKHPELLEFFRIKGIELFRRYTFPRWMMFLLDSSGAFCTFLLAYLLQYNLTINDFSLNRAIDHAIIATSLYTIVSLFFRPYAGLIRHTTIVDILKVLITTTTSLILLLVFSIAMRQIGQREDLIIPFFDHSDPLYSANPMADCNPDSSQDPIPAYYQHNCE